VAFYKIGRAGNHRRNCIFNLIGNNPHTFSSLTDFFPLLKFMLFRPIKRGRLDIMLGGK